MSNSDWPDISPELLQKLDDAVPELCPLHERNDREVWMYFGRRAVVRILHSIYDEQNSAD